MPIDCHNGSHRAAASAMRGGVWCDRTLALCCVVLVVWCAVLWCVCVCVSLHVASVVV